MRRLYLTVLGATRTVNIGYLMVPTTSVNKETLAALIKSFGRLVTNGKLSIPFVVSLSTHEWNQLAQRFPRTIYKT
jgi:hypothetical protein